MMNNVVRLFLADGLQPGGDYFHPSAILSTLHNMAVGQPWLIQHDYAHLVGWTYPAAILIEPGRTYGIGISERPEDAEDEERLRNLYLWDQRRVAKDDHGKALAHLESLLGRHLTGKYHTYCREGVSIVQPGLVKKALGKEYPIAKRGGLISMSELEQIGPGAFKFGPYCLFAHPHLRRSLSSINALNTRLLVQLQYLASVGAEVTLAFDPDRVGLAADYQPVQELRPWDYASFAEGFTLMPLAVAYGLPTNAANNPAAYTGTIATEWIPESTEEGQVLRIEELRNRDPDPPIKANTAAFGCRYAELTLGDDLHVEAVGYVTGYEHDLMETRLSDEQEGPRRQSPSRVLWRISRTVPEVAWKRTVAEYFQDNSDVGRLLRASIAGVDDVSSDGSPHLPTDDVSSEESPALNTNWSGPRIALMRILRPSNDRLGAGTQIASRFGLRPLGPVIPSEALLYALAAAKTGIEKYIGVEGQSAGKGQSACSITWHTDDTVWLLWFAGKRDDILGWLNSDTATPPETDGQMGEWVNEVANFLSSHYEVAEAYPDPVALILSSDLIYERTLEVIDGRELEIVHGIVFRNGSDSDGNLTPDFEDDVSGEHAGLSASLTVAGASSIGGTYQGIDTRRMEHLVAIRTPTEDDPGHVSIRPRSVGEIKDWANARGTDKTHALTSELRNARINRDKRRQA